MRVHSMSDDMSQATAEPPHGRPGHITLQGREKSGETCTGCAGWITYGLALDVPCRAESV